MKILAELRKIRRDVWIYILLAYSSTFAVDGFIIFGKESVYKSTYLVALRMWTPGITAILLTFFLKKKGLAQLIKAVPKFRYLWWAYAIPLFLGLMTFGMFAICGVSSVGPRSELIQKLHGLGPFLLKVLLYYPTIGLAIPFFACLGEEIGWRGYLFSETENLSVGFRRAFNGIIWAIYHWPLILFADYATSSNHFYSLVMFSVFVIFQAVCICWLQEKSKSLWTSVLFHAVHNMWIIGIFPVFYVSNDKTPYLIGEGGIFLTVVYGLAAWLLTRFKSDGSTPLGFSRQSSN